MLGLSLLKTRRHIGVKVRDPDWITTRIDRIAAYCNGYTKLRGRRNQTTPLLIGEAEDGWRTTSVYKTITIRPKGEDRLQECVVGKDNVAYHNDKLNTIMDSICNQCNNHCTACVYDCQIRYDDDEYDVENVVDDMYEVGNTDEVLDKHRPLSQTGCKPIVRKCDEPCSLLRSKSGKKSLRKKRRCVIGGDKITDPMWPAVLLTFERGISESFRETHKSEIVVY